MSSNDFFKKEIRLSGSGGQGLILAGVILAKAAVKDRFRVAQTQSYGPESRGGASRADVIISNDEIYFPEATRFDVLLALTQEACDKYLYDLKDKGVLIADNSIVKNIFVMDSRVFELPFTEIAIDKLGNSLATNILSLSFLTRISKIVTAKSLEEAIIESVKKPYIDLNIKAMNLGIDLAEEELKAEGV